MKRLKKFIAFAVAFAMLLQVPGEGMAFAAQADNMAFDPYTDMTLTVPNSLRDGNNYFFIREKNTAISENSTEKLYIPIQRTGDLSEEAEVTLKIIELSAKHGVNYEAEIYRESIEPEIDIADISLMELALSADSQEETELFTEDEMGQLVSETGGAQLVDTSGNPVGSITAEKVSDSAASSETDSDTGEDTDENKNSDEDTDVNKNSDEDTDVNKNSDEASEWTETEASAAETGPAALRAARDAFTGTASDRQKLEEPDSPADSVLGDLADMAAENGSDTDADIDADDIVEDAYPGREYRLHFNAGQEARFLVITPLYSEERDGDSQIMLTLKKASENMLFPDDFGPVAITIENIDTPEDVHISMAEETVYAENGTVSITVNRSGRLKSIAGVHIASWDGSAKQGKDYGGVGADLYFPMGIQSRTIELPVGNGAEEKDFNVTITDKTGVNIGTATTHVIISPAPKAEGDGETADIAADVRYGEAINLKDKNPQPYGDVFEWEDDYTFMARTAIDSTGVTAGLSFISEDAGGYFYDGLRFEYSFYNNFCYASAKIWGYPYKVNGSWELIHENNFNNDGGFFGGQSFDYYYGSEQVPYHSVSFGAVTRGIYSAVFEDRYAQLNVTAIKPILRRFDIELVDAVPLGFEGMSAEEELKQCEYVSANGSVDTYFSIYSGDNFSVSRPVGIQYPSYVGLEAVHPSDSSRSYRLATIDGKTSTATVELKKDLVNSLAREGYIKWDSDGDSRIGNIKVRPVFEYQNVTVNVRDTPYGVLKYNGKELPAGTHTFHKGDRLTFEPNTGAAGVEAGMKADGVGWLARESNSSGKLLNQNKCDYYIASEAHPGGAVTYTLLNDYYEFWQVFTEEANSVRVRVPQDEIQYLDTSKGLFAGLTPEASDGYNYYTIRSNVNNNELTELKAYTLSSDHALIWTLPNNDTRYSGNVFYFNTGVSAADNLVTLKVDREAGSHAYYAVDGSVHSSTMNLATGQKALDTLPAYEALITAGDCMGVTDDKGRYSLNMPVYMVGDSTLRYTVTYSGVTSIQEAKGAPASASKKSFSYGDTSGNIVTLETIPLSAGNVKVDNYSVTGAHIANVSVDLEGASASFIGAMKMNGNRLTVKVEVDPGQGYMLNGESLKENIKDLEIFFQSQYTGEIHGIYSISDTSLRTGNDENKSGVTLDWDASSNTATLNILKFSPDAPKKWTYGDVLMLRLFTDKRSGVSSWSGGDNVYDPVSTGYAVYTDLDREPETFHYEIDSLAEEVGYTGGDGNTRYTFGEFPYLGEITAAVKIFNTISSFAGGPAQTIATDAAADDGDEVEDYNPSDDGLTAGEPGEASWGISFYFDMVTTSFGGVRFMIGAAIFAGGGSGYKKQANPYKSAKAAAAMFPRWGTEKKTTSEIEEIGSAALELIYRDKAGLTKAKMNAMRQNFGGPYFTVGVYMGLYLDYGFITETTKNEDGTTEKKSGEMVYMGAGGFFGFSGTVGVNVPFFIWIMPAYFAPEASFSVRVFLGRGANPNMTLQSFQKNKAHKGQDFKFNVEVLGSIKAGANIGIGVYKLLGGRIYVGVTFDFGYGKNMAEWYPNVGSNWGTSLGAEFSGTLDIIIGSIALYSASVPIAGSGWLEYREQINMANKLIGYVNRGINDKRGTQEAREQCRIKADELARTIDAHKSGTETIRTMRKDLLSYAADNDVLTATQIYSANLRSQGGIAGAIMEALISSEDSEDNNIFHTRDRVRSEWTAGQTARISGAFKAAESERIVEDAFAQTASQIQPIGGNRYLIVYLADGDKGRDKAQASTLMWVVYNASTGTFEGEPRAVQDDGTADGKPNLIKAGDGRLVLSWASIPEGSYSELKEDVRTTIAEERYGDNPSEAQKSGVTDAEIAEYLEDHPTLVMSCMEIFSAEFNADNNNFTYYHNDGEGNKGESTSEILTGNMGRITFDEFCDDYPQAVYDEKTGDYIVLYYKTAQDDSVYGDDENRKLMDLVGTNSDPEATYCVLCYMLHNNQTEAKDTNLKTHERGWAVDYLFPNETELDTDGQSRFLSQWNGQRFLPSVIKTVDSEGNIINTDPPMNDLTTCMGYNGLAAFAYTVETDLSLMTAEDRALYVQFYDFEDHSTYVPVQIAGKVTEEQWFDPENPEESGYQARNVTRNVEVGSPKLVRNGGNTWLFWREDAAYLKYVNISELLNAKVAAVANPDPNNENDWTYALKTDGSFAVDANTNTRYEPVAQKVDFGSSETPETMNITDYQVITDAKDDLYVIWTQGTTYKAENEVIGEYDANGLPIYATAKIKEEDFAETRTTDEGTEEMVPARWSKPYKLTDEKLYNDGIAVALDDEGGLIIVHNQFEKLLADSTEKLNELAKEGKGRWITDTDGEQKFKGSMFYDSDINLMLTRCAPVASVEATKFDFSVGYTIDGKEVEAADRYPVAGEEIKVRATVENTGLTTAKGWYVDFYAYKDGKRQGDKLYTFSGDDTYIKTFPVNTSQTAEFTWTVPEEGAEGYSIQAVAYETGYDDPVVTYSDAFGSGSDFVLAIDSVKQQDDDFIIKYHVSNVGNAAVEEGTEASIELQTLYGDPEEVYGISDTTLVKDDISGLQPRMTRRFTKTVKIPVSVFKYCGYDALNLVITDGDGALIDSTDDFFVSLEKPINLSINGGEEITVAKDSTAKAELAYESTVFIESEAISYSVEDPDIASVDNEGTIIPLSNGTTILTATMLPSGRTASVPLTVTGYSDNNNNNNGHHSGGGGGGGTAVIPADPNNPANPNNPDNPDNPDNPSGADISFTDVPENTWFTDAVKWAVEKGITNGTTETTFSPNQNCTRAQMVTFLWRAAGSPEPEGTDNPFGDVDLNLYYGKAVQWAVEKGITKGTTDTTFSPDDTVSRAQTVTFIYRAAGSPEVTNTEAALQFTDLDPEFYYMNAVNWAWSNNITNGTGADIFSPDDYCTRAQIVTLLYRYFETAAA